MIDRDQFLDILDRLSLNGEVGEPSPYSGRAMYGKQCVSISGDSASEWGLAVAVASECRVEGLDPRDIPEPRVDSLGRGFVLYWPHYEWPEDRPDPDRYDPDDD